MMHCIFCGAFGLLMENVPGVWPITLPYCGLKKHCVSPRELMDTSYAFYNASVAEA